MNGICHNRDMFFRTAIYEGSGLEPMVVWMLLIMLESPYTVVWNKQKATQSRRNQAELAASDDEPAEADGAEVQIIGNIFNNPDESPAASSSSKAAFGAVSQFDLTPRFSKPGQGWQIF